MIEFDKVEKIYRSPAKEVRALHEVSFCIEPGEFVAVRGASGSGKSTLLALVGGLTLPTAGEVRVAGKNLARLTSAQRAEFRAKNVGFVFQMFHLLPYLTVIDNVLLAAASNGEHDPRGRAEHLLSRFGLSHRLRHRPAELSAGERQRAAIARALLNEPPLILADEPTGNLDPRNAAAVLDLLGEHHANGGSVLLVTHSEQAAAYAQRSLELDSGRLLEASLGRQTGP